MKLKWNVGLDMSVCFSLQFIEHEQYILVHGESKLSKIDLDGNILWQFSGSDILVTEDGYDSAEIIDDKIYITDWNNVTHILNFDGKVLENRTKELKNIQKT